MAALHCQHMHVCVAVHSCSAGHRAIATIRAGLAGKRRFAAMAAMRRDPAVVRGLLNPEPHPCFWVAVPGLQGRAEEQRVSVVQLEGFVSAGAGCWQCRLHQRSNAQGRPLRCSPPNLPAPPGGVPGSWGCCSAAARPRLLAQLHAAAPAPAPAGQEGVASPAASRHRRLRAPGQPAQRTQR